MRYYKMTDAEGKLTAIGTGSGGTEITAGEYTALSAEIAEKAALVAALADGRISAENIREDWREEIVWRAETEDEPTTYTEDELAEMTNEEYDKTDLSSAGRRCL